VAGKTSAARLLPIVTLGVVTGTVLLVCIV